MRSSMPESEYPSGDRRSSSRHHYHHHSRRQDTRSRSPRRKRNDRSPYRRSRREDGRGSERTRSAEPLVLPLGAGPLSKRDLATYKPLFAMYLDIQKNIDLEELDDRELRGRWKSFMKKWNRGELAEGWYDAATLEKAQRSTHSTREQQPGSSRSRSPLAHEDRWNEAGTADRRRDEASDDDMDDDEGYGPQLPSEQLPKRPDERSGPTIPTMQDLQMQREEARESREAAREAERLSHKYARQSHKSELRALEDEIAPRAEPGTHERKMEKRQERAASNRAFAESRRGGSPGAALPDTELMGGGDDLEALKRAKEKETRKKNEREIRREEVLRARAAEREERLEGYRRKEEETMEFLRSLAKQRFG